MTAARSSVVSTRLRPLLASGLFALVAGMSHAAAAESAGAVVPVKMPPPTWAWRQAVQQAIDSPVPALQATGRNELLSPLLLHAGADADVITLPTLRVNGSGLAREIKREYAIAVQREKDAAVLHRLGTGMHQVGSRHFGVLTVFYIPVFAGFQWSW